MNKIQGVLKDNCISFYLNSVQFEEETGYQHYEWVWDCLLYTSSISNSELKYGERVTNYDKNEIYFNDLRPDGGA